MQISTLNQFTIVIDFFIPSFSCSVTSTVLARFGFEFKDLQITKTP